MKLKLAPYLPLAALAITSAWPLLHAGPPGDLDGPLHFYRFVELDWHIRHGDWFPRWFADVHYGFGGPILNFYAPLAYYLLVFLRLFIASFSNSFLAGFVVAAVLAVVGMYLWASDQFGSPLAGLTGAAAYAFTPHFYDVAFVRGALPETLALALVPWLFWATLRLLRNATHRNRIVFTLLYAALFLTHNLSALLFTPVLMVYCLVSAWQLPGLSRRQRLSLLGQLGLGLAHAVLLSAFFLLPFVSEAPYVQLQKAGKLDYHNNFSTLEILLSLPVRYDPNYIFNPVPDSLPWPQLSLALIAIASLVVSRRSDNRRLAGVLTVIGLQLIALAFLTQSASARLWEAFPFSYLIQYPPRLLSPATLLLAWLSAAGIAGWPAPRLRWPLALAALAGIFYYSIPWSYHDPYPYPDNASPLDVVKYEIANPESFGTTQTQEFLPRWVGQSPAPDTLLQRYTTAAPPPRLAPLPAGIKVIDEHDAVTATDLRYDSPTPFTATFYLFYFPGWTAALDGRSVPVRPADTSGWLTLDAPAGQHSLHLSLQPTPPQQLGAFISLVGLALLVLPLGVPANSVSAQSKPPAPALSPAWAVLLIGLLTSRVAVIDRMNTPFNSSEWNAIPNPMTINFGDQLKLIGFQFPHGPTLASGGVIHLALYWLAPTLLTTRYSTSVQLVDAYGNRFGQTDHYSPANIPTPWWHPGNYARDDHTLTALAGTPPGTYHLHISVYSGDTGAPIPLNVINDDGSTTVDFDLGPVLVTPAAPLPPGPLRLVSHSLASAQVSVGDRLPFALAWNSGSAALPPLTARLQFTRSDGQVIFTANLPPAGPDYPTDRWTPNALILFPQSVTLPADLPAGPVRVSLTLVRQDGSAASNTYDLGQLAIVVPPRTFAVPPMSHAAGHDFNNAIRLLGYDVAGNAITLYWLSLRPVPLPLTVFVHRFTADGKFAAGHDSPPARSTTSWLPGEVLTDVKPFAVGDYFEVGLYDPVTGDRFGEPYVVKP